MEAFQFQRTKKRQATEDNAAGEQKNYCLVLNSNDRVAGTKHNEAEFNINFEFLPHNYEYYQMDYAFVTNTGVYKDTYAEFGGSIGGTLCAAQIFDSTTPAGSIIAPGAKLTTTDTSVILPLNLAISNFRTGLSTGGQYQMNQSIATIATTTFTGTMASGSNTITSVSGGTPIIGRFVNVAGALANGARVLYQDPVTPTTWYVSKTATGTITAGSFTQYVPITARLNNTVANLSVDFGCKKFIYDTDTQGQSAFMGSVQRYTGSSLSGTNYYRSWWDEQCPQIINMNNFSGTIRTRITNADGFLLEDSTATGLPLGDMTPWQLFLSFTPIPSSAIETQCY